MRDGQAKAGMRVSFNAKARSTRGIGTGIRGEPRHHVQGCVVQVDNRDLGLGPSDMVQVRWDDGDVGWVNVYWIRRTVWQRGGYTHGKRREEA